MKKIFIVLSFLVAAGFSILAQDQILLPAFTSGFDKPSGSGAVISASIGVIAADTSTGSGVSLGGGFFGYTINTVPPTRVANFTANPVDTTQVTLAWQASIGDTSSFRYFIYRGATRTGAYQRVDSTIRTQLNINDIGRVRKTVYFYYVTAKNRWGTSYTSDTAQVTTYGEPDTPSSFTAQLESGKVNRIQMTWSASDFDPSQYKIYRSNQATTGFVAIDSVHSGTLVFTDSTLQLGATYYYNVRAKNSWGESAPTITRNVTSGNLTLAYSGTPPTNVTENQSALVQATINADRGNGDIVKLYYKAGGAASYSDSADMNYSGGVYSYSIPWNKIASRGAVYFVRARVGNSNQSESEKHITAAITSGVTKSNSQPVAVAKKHDLSKFEIISIPLDITGAKDVNTVLGSIFGEKGKEWEIWNYSSGNQIFTGNIASGKGYWFITTKEGSLKTGAAKTFTTETPYTVSVQSGWNIIGNPFHFDVSTSDIIPSSGVSIENSKFYTWGVNKDWQEVSSIKPWFGYYVKVIGNGNLLIYPKAAGSVSKPLMRSVASDFDKGEWLINIQAVSEEIADKHNFIGALSHADDAVDEEDYYDTPLPPGDQRLHLYFPHKDWGSKSDDYGIDMRRVSEEGHTWDFEVSTNITRSHIVIGEPVNLPENFSVRVMDTDLRVMYDAKQQKEIPVILTSKTSDARHYKVLVGTEAYINVHDMGFSTLPTGFELKQNYPNPFNPTTTIKFALPVASKIEITIYNALGQVVRKLADREYATGYQFVQWDGKDNRGSMAASGVYIYRLTARSLDGSGKNFTKSQKMLLMK